MLLGPEQRTASALRPRSRFAELTVAAGALAVVAVTVTAVVPDARVAQRSLELQAAVETTLALIALLAAYLLAGRSARSGRRGDILLACGFAMLALTNLSFGAVPGSLGARDTDFLAWAGALGAAAAAALLAAAGFAGAGRLRLRRPVPAIAAGAVAVVGLAAIAALVVASTLSSGLSPELPPRRSELLHGHVALNVLHGVTATLFAAAAVASLRALAHRDDQLVGWVAAGTALSAGGWASYALLPVSATSWVALGDALRLGFYLLVLAGAVREIGSYQRRLMASAIADERRRIARDMHDGLAQDLAFISTAVDDRGDTAEGRDLREAARRAMVEARSLLDALAGRERSPEAELEEAGRQIAALHGIDVDFRVDLSANLAPPELQCLQRILIEAIRNAARHGPATRVEVELERMASALCLRVSDDGRGFDPDAVPEGRFGLVSMRERVASFGGELRIRSRPGRGTIVEALLP